MHLFIGESPGDLNPPSLGWIWIKPSTGQIFERTDGEWIEVVRFPVLNNGSIDVSETVEASKGEFGTLEVGGRSGIDSEVVVGGTTLRFKGGILYSVEA